jgi:dsRNA-specific ribonuclease
MKRKFNNGDKFVKKRKIDSESELSDINQYNPNNVLITKKFVENTLFNVIGQRFSINNLHFYQTAFVHKSMYKKNIAPPYSKTPIIFVQTYESLEFLGDAWLDAITADYLYHRFPDQDEGFLTRIKSKIVKEKQLIKFSETLNFHKYAIIPNKIERMIGRLGVKYLEDMFEAFCAAIVEDMGISVLMLFIKHLIEKEIDFNNIILFDDDYKSMLLRLHQKNAFPHPTYTLISQDGPGHSKVFLMGLDYVEDLDNIEDIDVTPKEYTLKHKKTGEEYTYKCLTTGESKSKKDAEQIASKRALELFGMTV